MEHEVYVPFPVGQVRAALTDRERLVRCVPGLQLDAGDGRSASGPGSLSGRLRVRVGSSSITYRGSLTVTPEGDGIAVEGSGTEVRGTGSATLKLTVVPRLPQDGEGTRLVFAGTVSGDGRLAEFEEKPATSAAKRVLDRFTTAFVDTLREQPPEPGAPAPHEAAAEGVAEVAPGIGDPDDNEPAIPGIPGPEKGSPESPSGGARDAEPDGTDEEEAPADASAETPADTSAEHEAPAPPADDAPGTDSPLGEAGTPPQAEDTTGDHPAEDAADEDTPPGPDKPSVFDTEIPPSSLDPLEDGLDEPGAEGPGEPGRAGEGLNGASPSEGSTAEAAHARRTMIGRSAEEVDHAPPRGRYAPVPSPEPADAAATLRWAAPAAAVVVAGAVVLGRALRRRR
ncbi:SRPBCC domain-containing protein [Streptomyces sp. HNM0574]|uniref:SRPBCC domain-containing protein n=1 Tax=Streptomyces sp. HNM0574 TaxID=2714954 RepID=UPI00146C7D02|nr:SRPBCC domain-containing protein [Streptomyces sp. HNM0574]NLU68585.1 hypothetical protein [Streptomyces sp. HNM0574]